MKKLVVLSIAFLLFHFNLLAQKCNWNGKDRIDYLSSINCSRDFSGLQSKPLKNNYANISSIKIVYDLHADEIYFINSIKYKFHYTFCAEYLETYPSLEQFNEIEYSNKKERLYAICNLNFDKNSKHYWIDFFSDDEIKSKNVLLLFNKIKSTTFFGDSLKIINNSLQTQNWKKELNVPFVEVDEIYSHQRFQAMYLGKSIGYLKFVDNEKQLETLSSSHSIIVLNFLPKKLPVCVATITNFLQTPLCHINVLANNRNTPNCFVKDIATNENYKQYKDKLVEINVSDAGLQMQFASLTKANNFWKFKETNKLVNISLDGTEKSILNVKQLSINSTSKVGSKAANLGELDKIQLSQGRKIELPKKIFAIPFYYYLQHIKNNKIDFLIDSFLRKKNEFEHTQDLKTMLTNIQQKITETKIDDVLIQLIKKEIGGDSLSNFRFRSSTNAEDILDFNGAGLYDSKTGNLTNKNKPIDKAIKQVWASLWSFNAFKEREYFNINQKQVAMGVLVNTAFGEEEANGVAITKNMYRVDYPAFTVNVQKGETSVVNPPNDSIKPEIFVINLSTINQNLEGNYSIDFITHSSLQKEKSILSNNEVKQLTTYLVAIKQHYWRLFKSKVYTSYNDFAMDVEFKLEKATRKVVIKQARLY